MWRRTSVSGETCAMSLAMRVGERGVIARVEQLEPVDQKVVVLAQRHGRPPALPAIGVLALIERGAEEADGDARFHSAILSEKIKQSISS